MNVSTPVVHVSPDDARRLSDAIDEGCLFAASWTSPGTLEAYASHCYHVGRVQIIVSPASGRPGYRNVVVDTFPKPASYAQMAGLEIALRNFGDVYEMADPDDTGGVVWRVQVSDAETTDLVPRILDVFDMLPTVDPV